MSNLANKSQWFLRHLKREWQIYVMLAPAIIWFITFLYTPMYGLQVAFKDYSIFKGVRGLASSTFILCLITTISFVLLKTPPY